MPKVFHRTCDQCQESYRGSGARFCSRSCRMTYRNFEANPAKHPDARAKIGLARRGKPTTLGQTCPADRRLRIAAALQGRELTRAHREAISAGLLRSGVRPPVSVMKGSQHPNWKGGYSSIRQTDYRSKRYRDFRKSVLDRDSWACRDCDATRVQFHVHHLKSWGPYPKLRYRKSNGLTLCVPCHKARHRGVPRPVTVGPRTIADRLSVLV